MPLRLPDLGSFEDLLRPTRVAVASLVRLSRHPATEPYWSAGVYRFDDPDPAGATAFGTCYTASTIEVAFAESVIHECGRFVGASHEVPVAELTERWVVRFVCERRKTLVLADLTGAALKALFERSGLCKLRADKLAARQVDALCAQFNVTAV